MRVVFTFAILALVVSAVFCQTFTTLVPTKTEYSVEPNTDKLFKLDESKNTNVNLVRFAAQGCNYGSVALYIKICDPTVKTCVDSENVPSKTSFDVTNIIGSGQTFTLCSFDKNKNLCSSKNVYYIRAYYNQDLLYDNTVSRYFSLGYTTFVAAADAPMIIDRNSFNLTMNTITEFAWTTPKVCSLWDSQAGGSCIQWASLTNVQYQLYYVEQSIIQFFSFGMSGLSWNIESECGSKRAGAQKLGPVLNNVNSYDTSDLSWFGYMTMSVSGTDPNGKTATANNISLYPFVRIDFQAILKYAVLAAIGIVGLLCCCVLCCVLCCVVSCVLTFRPKRKQYYTQF